MGSFELKEKEKGNTLTKESAICPSNMDSAPCIVADFLWMLKEFDAADLLRFV